MTTIVLSTIITVLSVIILTVTTLTVVAVIVLRSLRRSCLCSCGIGILRCLLFYGSLRGCSIIYRLFRRLLSLIAGYHCHTGCGRRRGQRLDGTYGSLCLHTVIVRIVLIAVVLISVILSLVRTLSAGISLSLSVLSALTLSGHLGILRVAYKDDLFLLFRLFGRFCFLLRLFLSRLCIFSLCGSLFFRSRCCSRLLLS